MSPPRLCPPGWLRLRADRHGPASQPRRSGQRPPARASANPRGLPVIDPAHSYAAACRDPNLFGPWFAKDSWSTWSVFDKAIFGDPLNAAELAIFQELTGRAEAPTYPVAEAWVIAGRRSGKDVKAASIIAYLATIGAHYLNFAQYLTPGERGVVQLFAVDRNQSKVCLSYLKAMFQQPMLAAMIESETADGLELNNRLTIEITTNSKRRARGSTVVAAVFDEVAHWLNDEGGSQNADTEVYDAVKPAMATIPGAMLIGISSPYARRGLLWKKFRKHYGAADPQTLVIKAPTWRMNPTLKRDAGIIAQAYEDDPIAASAEYGAEFRSDVAGFLDFDAIQACIDRSVRERPPIPAAPTHGGKIEYFAFADPSGGSNDAMTLGIAHHDPRTGTAILDLAREIRPPFDPAIATAEFCNTIKSYGLSTVTGDRYAAQWVVSAFAAHGIEYVHTTRSRSEIYLELLPAINSQSIRLLDIPKLHTQLGALERRTSRSARDSVDHPPGGHDDLANAAAGALVLAAAAHAPQQQGEAFVIDFGGQRGSGHMRSVYRKVSYGHPPASDEKKAEIMKAAGFTDAQIAAFQKRQAASR